VAVSSGPRGHVGRTLSRERIVRTALDMLDRDGIDELSMRRLAEALGVGTMTLYGYFRTKGELLDAVADSAAGEEALPPRRGSWRAQLRTLMRQVRRNVVRHPNLAALRMNRPLLSAGVLRVAERGYEILRAAGFDEAGAARGYRLLFTYTFGSALFSGPEPSEQLKREARAALVRLPPEEYPALTTAADAAVEALGGDAQFEFGLERLLDGLELLLDAEPPAG
jgi:AcrR family transcriptional regulator